MESPTDIEILTERRPSVLDRLASHQAWQVRAHVASSRFTSIGTLARLVADPSAAVRAAVAHNPDATTSILVRLAEDPDSEVREEALGHPKTPAETLLEAVRGSDPPPLTVVARWVSRTDQKVPIELAVRCLDANQFAIRRIGIECLLRLDG